MAYFSVGTVLSADQREDCYMLRIDDGLFRTRSLVLKPPYTIVPCRGDCIVYTTDNDNRRILEIGMPMVTHSLIIMIIMGI